MISVKIIPNYQLGYYTAPVRYRAQTNDIGWIHTIQMKKSKYQMHDVQKQEAASFIYVFLALSFSFVVDQAIETCRKIYFFTRLCNFFVWLMFSPICLFSSIKYIFIIISNNDYSAILFCTIFLNARSVWYEFWRVSRYYSFVTGCTITR